MQPTFLLEYVVIDEDCTVEERMRKVENKLLTLGQLYGQTERYFPVGMYIANYLMSVLYVCTYIRITVKNIYDACYGANLFTGEC